MKEGLRVICKLVTVVAVAFELVIIVLANLGYVSRDSITDAVHGLVTLLVMYTCCCFANFGESTKTPHTAKEQAEKSSE